MKKVPDWVWIILIFTFFSLLFSPLLGIIILVFVLIYLNNHGYLTKKVEPRKPNSIPRSGFSIPKSGVKRDIPKQRKKGEDPPQFIRKIEFLSNREIAFSNFSSVRYLEESGSHQMVDIKNPRNAKIYIRLNQDQFDVFLDCNGNRAQLSFEKSNLKVLDITNHDISMIEGNRDDSYLKINYDNQFFTTLEVEELMDFFHEFSISNKTTKFQEQPIFEDVEPIVKPPRKKNFILPKVLAGCGICLLVVGIGITVMAMHVSKPVYSAETLLGNRTNTMYVKDVEYEINNELESTSWGEDERYTLSNLGIPELSIHVLDDGTDRTHTYNYEKSTFQELEDELECYTYKYNAQKKQYDFVNLTNGKWYHFSGVAPEDVFYQNKTKKDIFIDIYVMPTNKGLIEVSFLRTIDDTNDYDIVDFVSKIDYTKEMNWY